MDLSRNDMIDKMKGTGSIPVLSDSKFFVNLQNPKKTTPSLPKNNIIQNKIDKVINSKSWKIKENFIELTKKRKSFLFNFVILSIFLLSLTFFLIYQRSQKKDTLKSINNDSNKKLHYSNFN